MSVEDSVRIGSVETTKGPIEFGYQPGVGFLVAGRDHDAGPYATVDDVETVVGFDLPRNLRDALTRSQTGDATIRRAVHWPAVALFDGVPNGLVRVDGHRVELYKGNSDGAYHGQYSEQAGQDELTFVSRTGEIHALPHVAVHGEGHVSWGYSGTAPKNAAYVIVRDALARMNPAAINVDEVTRSHYLAFVTEKLTALTPNEPFDLELGAVREWLIERKADRTLRAPEVETTVRDRPALPWALKTGPSARAVPVEPNVVTQNGPGRNEPVVRAPDWSSVKNDGTTHRTQIKTAGGSWSIDAHSERPGFFVTHRDTRYRIDCRMFAPNVDDVAAMMQLDLPPEITMVLGRLTSPERSSERTSEGERWVDPVYAPYRYDPSRHEPIGPVTLVTEDNRTGADEVWKLEVPGGFGRPGDVLGLGDPHTFGADIGITARTPTGSWGIEHTERLDPADATRDGHRVVAMHRLVDGSIDAVIGAGSLAAFARAIDATFPPHVMHYLSHLSNRDVEVVAGAIDRHDHTLQGGIHVDGETVDEVTGPARGTYAGTIGADGAKRLLYADPTARVTVLPHRATHSPDGFNWGFDGNGTLDAARSIVGHALRSEGLSRDAMPEVRDSHYRAFASDVLTRFNTHVGFELALDEVSGWLHERGALTRDTATREPEAGRPVLADLRAADTVAVILPGEAREMVGADVVDPNVTSQRRSDPDGRIDALPLRDQLTWTGADLHIDVPTLAAMVGLQEGFVRAVLTRERSELSIEEVAAVCEGMHCDPYDLWPPDVVDDDIATQYPRTEWPENRDRLDPPLGVRVVTSMVAIAGGVALAEQLDPVVLDAATGLLLAAKDADVRGVVAELSDLARKDPRRFREAAAGILGNYDTNQRDTKQRDVNQRDVGAELPVARTTPSLGIGLDMTGTL